MGKVVELSGSTFEQEIIKSEIPSIVDFFAEWCMPCKVMGPVMDEIANEFDGRVKIGKLNIDENAEMATNMTVMNIPTLIFFKDGQEAGRVTGVASKDAIITKIQELL